VATETFKNHDECGKGGTMGDGLGSVNPAC
jgi:hypothetical protein